MCALQDASECVSGLTLGHYQLLEKIGAGGMGEVFRARDLHLERDVAIKILPRGIVSDEATRKRFRREALTLSRLNHPNIATVHDFDNQQGIDFLVMEYVSGVCLSDRMTRGPLRENEVIALATQLADGLSAAHEHGVIHRDLKPGNVRLTDDGLLKILDFGLAKLRTPVNASASTQTASETQTLAGTLLYMAPEQLLSEPADVRSDIYATGVVLYELATGRHPFSNVGSALMIGAILRLSPPSPRTLDPSLSPELVRIIEKCLEKEPGNRYQSARELGIDLHRLGRTSEHPFPVNPAPAPSLLKRKLWLAAISAALALVVFTGAFIVRQLRKDRLNVEISKSLSASIAVLPFEDLSPGHDHGYFSDGLAEEILNSLTKIPQLRVVARTSAFQFRSQSADLRLIGHTLNVANILEGSVQSSGSRIRITVHLTNADAGQSLWSENYDREFRDVFAVEDEIAAAVTTALQPRLLASEPPTAPSPSAKTNPDAYVAFLQARSLFRSVDVQLEPKAFEYIDRAIQSDPNYAPAYALRSVMAAESGLMGRRDLTAAIDSSRRDAQKAIGLDPNLAAGYRALSETQGVADWNWQAAELSVNKARALAPGDADILGQCAYLAMSQGRLEEGAQLALQGLELDPLQPSAYASYGQILRDLGRFEDARAAFQKALDLSPNQQWTHELMGEVYLAQGRPQEALTEMEKEPQGPWQDYGLSLANAALGKTQESDAALRRLIHEAQDIAAYQVAEVYAFRGERDQAFSWLERARRLRDGGFGRIKSDWIWRNLRSDPRFLQFLRQANLPE